MWNKVRSWFSSGDSNSIINYDFLDQSKKTILIIDDDIPQHDKSSGSKRLFELIKIFKKMAFNVIFLPNNGRPDEPYYTQLKNLDVEVLLFNPGRKSMLRKLNKLLSAIDYAWISRPMLNRAFQPIVSKNKKVKIIFDTVDLHYIRMLRQAESEQNEKLKRKALKFKKLELQLAKNAKATVTVTDTEKKLLEKELIQNVFVVPNIHELSIPNHEIPFSERNGLVFIGGYKHEPNIDAVKWLINDIMPQVWNALGKIPVYLLGSYPNEEVLKLANIDVIVPGYIEDVSKYFLNAKIFIAPLRYGAGMKGKIGQSLEFGLPIVSTTIGAEGMNLIHEKNVLIADQSKDFANQIITIYQDEQLWTKIKKNAFQSIVNYTPTAVEKQLENLFQNLDSK
ncbi:glycosyltransferase [Pedobacter sp. CCM 8938]|uniref:Glycosyltransferase n=2 Tax=Pedobacter fastidiosus TaxID=2765361 RepID=A0ABR7KSG4_9SPHI|nr:glycosyltransferase [Pedobacter fastidiosus]MBC6111027.1 glycosyltransferase [Pedobacter fastidiosus]